MVARVANAFLFQTWRLLCFVVIELAFLRLKKRITFSIGPTPIGQIPNRSLRADRADPTPGPLGGAGTLRCDPMVSVEHDNRRYRS